MIYNLAIVIPTFNRCEITLKCIKQIFESKIEAHILICDSGSTDETIKEVKKINNIELISVGSNNWWSGAVNFGIKEALSRNFSHIIIMNDDIYFDENIFTNLLSLSNNHFNSIISPSQIDKMGKYYGINFLGPFKNPFRISNVNAIEVLNVDITNGCFLLIPSCIFEKIGYFDEVNCPHLGGDTEFLLRAKNNNFNTLVSTKDFIRQFAYTNYNIKIKLSQILFGKGSPNNLKSHYKIGIQLYKSNLNFIFYGFFYNLNYLKSLIRSLFIIFKRSLN
jgi:GT2 family glycosyltransferase